MTEKIIRPSPRVTSEFGASGFSGSFNSPAYSGAHGGEIALWSPSVGSADSEVTHSMGSLVSRSRDLERNSPTFSGAVNTIKDSVVGEIYRLSSKPKTSVLGSDFDETWLDEFQAEVEDLFFLYGETNSRFADAEQTKTFTELVRLSLALTIVEGESIGVIEWDPGRQFRTCLQIVDRDRLMTPVGMTDGPRMMAGVEKGAFGQPIAYHISDGHPFDLYGASFPKSKRIPARTAWGRQNVIHTREQLRASMTRGIPQISSALQHAYMTKKWEENTLQASILHTLLALSIESERPPDEVWKTIGATDAAQYADVFGRYSLGLMESVHAMTGGAPRIGDKGPRIPIFHPGTSLKASNLGGNGPIGEDFEKSLHRKLSTGIGLSYQDLTNDYSDVSYAATRAAVAKMWRAIMSYKSRIADSSANGLYRGWLEEVLLRGMISSMPRRANAAWLLEAGGLRIDALACAEWIGGSKGYIDDKRESEAAIIRMKGGISTLETETSSRGMDWRDTIRQQRREMQFRKKMGLPEQPGGTVEADEEDRSDVDEK